MAETTEILDRLLRFKTDVGEGFWTKRLENESALKALQSTYYETVPSHPDVIFYESMSGARMMDSPFAIFDSLFRDPRFESAIHVWSVRTLSVVPERYRQQKNVIFVQRDTEAYLYLLARARYIVGNSVLPDYFVRKRDQKYLNTWHGVPFKTLGRSAHSPLGAVGSVYNMLQATHVISPCSFMTDVLMDSFSMKGVFAGALREVGYPRVDRTINITASERALLQRELNLQPDKKTVLYAPTWRGGKGRGKFDAERLIADLDELRKLDVNLVFLGHHIMLRHIADVDFGNVIVPPDNTNTNDLLGIVDILITDYSSIFFDFLVTGKPIIHYLYDYEEYRSERGLNLSPAELPGVIAWTSGDLLSELQGVLTEPSNHSPSYVEARNRFCPYDDGHATAQVIEWFFFDRGRRAELHTPSPAKSTVFWGGRLSSSDETTDYLRKLRSVAQSSEEIVVLFVARSVSKNPEVMAVIQELGNSITVITRNDNELAMTPDEVGARERLRNKQVGNDEINQLYRSMYEREYRRIFGDARFEKIIPFEGLTYFWKELAKHAYR